MTLFEDDLAARIINYRFVLVLGDFNADLLANNYKSERLKNFVTRVEMKIVPLNPTNLTAHADTWIDMCAVN